MITRHISQLSDNEVIKFRKILVAKLRNAAILIETGDIKKGDLYSFSIENELPEITKDLIMETVCVNIARPWVG